MIMMQNAIMGFYCHYFEKDNKQEAGNLKNENENWFSLIIHQQLL